MRLFFLLFSLTLIAQTEYTFDTVYIYEGYSLKVDKTELSETRYYFVNNSDPNYFLVLRDLGIDEIAGVFRDDKKNTIAEFIVTDQQISDISSVSVPLELLKRNSYHNPLPDKNLFKKKVPLNDSITRYFYRIERSKIFKNQEYTIDVDYSKTNIPAGLGFGDYYSLFPLGKNVPKGLVVQATTNEASETILSSMVLKEIKSSKRILIFR